MHELREEVKRRSRKWEAPDGDRVSILTLDAVRGIAARCGVDVRSVELHALKVGAIPYRYHRNIGSVGVDGQIALLESAVGVVGAGGLGGVVCEILARTGVGNLLLLDADVYDESNLNRQIHASERNLNRRKVEVTKDRIAAINSAVSVRARAEELAEENASEILRDVDLVVDCLDNVPDRFLLERTCAELCIPMVHGAVAGMTGQVLTVFPGDVGLTVLYGERDAACSRGVEVSLGNLGTVVTAVAAMQCQEVVKIINGAGEPSRDRALFLDLVSGRLHGVQLS